MNVAFIDGQNLNMGTKEAGWSIDHRKFRVYLREKYNVSKAFYFLGFFSEKEWKLYANLEKSGFILIFKAHSETLRGSKKGNVDGDIIFEIMRSIIEKCPFDKIFLISSDGDYMKLVEYLIQKNLFGKLLFPNRKFTSSLYKTLENDQYDYLENPSIKMKIEYKHI